MQAVSVPASEGIISTAAQMCVLAQRRPVVLYLAPTCLFNAATGIGQRQTLWGGTFTLQYKPAPSLITRAEFRYDKSDQNVFLRGAGEAINNQQTLSFQVVYLF